MVYIYCTYGNAAQIYVHNVSCGSRKVRVLRPFVTLGLMMMSVLCCLARFGLHYSHWEDVVVGFVVGLVLAVYMASCPCIVSPELICSFTVCCMGFNCGHPQISTAFRVSE